MEELDEPLMHFELFQDELSELSEHSILLISEHAIIDGIKMM